MFRIYQGHIDGNQLKDQTFVFAHGGAGPQDPSGSHRAEAVASLRIGLSHLNDREPASHSALSMAEYLEQTPLFNAGIGACLQDDGIIRVSASFMESEKQKFSAVINAEELMHPSKIAYALQNKRNCVLDGRGVQNFLAHRDEALSFRNEESNSLYKHILYTDDRLNRWLQYKREKNSGRSGTIGVVTLDSGKKIAAVTSTGGVGHEVAGRVGDSPTVAGNYCTTRLAVSCTGYGEQITSDAVAARLSAFVESGLDLQNAAERLMNFAVERGHSYAFIALHSLVDSGAVQWLAAEARCRMVWGWRAGRDYQFSN